MGGLIWIKHNRERMCQRLILVIEDSAMNRSPANSNTQSEPSLAHRALAFGEALVRYATDWIGDRRYLERHQRFIEDLDNAGELDGLLEALDITREQLRAFDLSPLASAELRRRMMERVGLAGVDINGARGSSDVPELRCRECASWRQCRRWLAREARDDGYSDFCPNAKLLDKLRLKAAVGQS